MRKVKRSSPGWSCQCGGILPPAREKNAESFAVETNAAKDPELLGQNVADARKPDCL
ncbi:hypothetical protein ACFLWV_02130 [Chloroflexota bacterium]